MSTTEIEAKKQEAIGHIIYIYGDLYNISSFVNNYLYVLDKLDKLKTANPREKG